MFVHKDGEMDMGLVLLLLMNCSFARLSNQMSLKGTKRNDYSFTNLAILCIVNLPIRLMLECISRQNDMFVDQLCYVFPLATCRFLRGRF